MGLRSWKLPSRCRRSCSRPQRKLDYLRWRAAKSCISRAWLVPLLAKRRHLYGSLTTSLQARLTRTRAGRCCEDKDGGEENEESGRE